MILIVGTFNQFTTFFYSTGTNLYFNLKLMCLIVIVDISDTYGQHWFCVSSKEIKSGPLKKNAINSSFF